MCTVEYDVAVYPKKINTTTWKKVLNFIPMGFCEQAKHIRGPRKNYFSEAL